MIYIFLALTLLGCTFYFKRNDTVQQFFYALIILATIFLLKDQLTPLENVQSFMGITGAILFVNLALSRILKTKIMRWLVPLFSLLAFFLLSPLHFKFEIYSISLKDTPVFSLLIGGFLLGGVLEAKDWLVRNYLFQLQTLRFGRAVIGAILGVLTIVSTFFTGFFGFIYIAIGLFLYTLYHKQRIGHLIPALLAMSATSYFLHLFSLESIDLLHGKVLAGLIIGACLYLLGDVSSRIYNPIIGIALFSLGISLVVIVSILNHIHPFYGGPESFVAGLFGFSIASLLIGNTQISSFGYPLLIVLGLIVPSSIEGPTSLEQPNKEQSTTKKASKEKSFADYENLSWDVLEGAYIIDTSSIISFQLGPKGGITKGAIKNISGTVTFDGDKSKFEVNMPVKNLTTFNSMQYESLMSTDYFNEAKFPLMHYQSNEVKFKENENELTGEFSMIGSKHSENVMIKYLGEIDGKPHFIGMSTINRPKYGFKPSPQEGDDVAFTFQLILIKK